MRRSSFNHSNLWARCHDPAVPNRWGDQAQRAGVMGASEHLLLLFLLPPLSPLPPPSLGLIPGQSHSRSLHPLGHCVPYICVPSQAVPVPCSPGLRPGKALLRVPSRARKLSPFPLHTLLPRPPSFSPPPALLRASRGKERLQIPSTPISAWGLGWEPLLDDPHSPERPEHLKQGELKSPKS